MRLLQNYFDAKERLHHHTFALIVGLILCGSLFSWHFSSLFVSTGQSSAAYSPTWCQENSGSIVIPLSECEALEDFYAALDGDNWTVTYTGSPSLTGINYHDASNGWFSNTTICNNAGFRGAANNGWTGFNYASVGGVICNASGHVYRLPMERSNLSGDIPDSFSNLTYLDEVAFNNNNISALPETMGDMDYWKRIDIENNNISSIPDSFSGMQRINNLLIGQNNLSSLPESFKDNTSLSGVYLRFNNFQEFPFLLTQMPQLRRILFNGNYIYYVPDEIGNLTGLTFLSLESNYLIDLPETIVNVPATSQFSVQSNCLGHFSNLGKTGVISYLDTKQAARNSGQNNCGIYQVCHNGDASYRGLGTGYSTGVAFYECVALVDIYNDLDHGSGSINRTGWFTGEVLSCNTGGNVQCLNGHVTSINLNSKGLSGTIPASIKWLTSLQHLSLQGNSISSLPEEIGELASLQRLFMNYNLLTELPASIGNLVNLEETYLNNNALTTLPSTISGWENILIVYLNDNQLSSLPTSIGELPSLDELYLYNNYLTTEQVSPLSSLTGLQQLWLENNLMTRIPESWSGFSQMQHLRLSNNQILYLPQSFLNSPIWGNLVSLTLANNYLFGVIPYQVTTANSLAYDPAVSPNDWYDNCLTTGYTHPSTITLLDGVVGGQGLSYDPAEWKDNQSNCRSGDLSLQASLIQTGLTEAVYIISYEHTGNVTLLSGSISIVVPDGLTVQDITGNYQNYTGDLIGEKYGVTGDSCYDAFVATGTTGAYVDVIFDRAERVGYNRSLDGVKSGANAYWINMDDLDENGEEVWGARFVEYLDASQLNWLNVTSSPYHSRLHYWLKEFVNYDTQTLWHSGCGLGGTSGYTFALGDVGTGYSGTITISVSVPTQMQGQVVRLTGNIDALYYLDTNSSDNIIVKQGTLLQEQSESSNQNSVGAGGGGFKPIIGDIQQGLCQTMDCSDSYYDSICGDCKDAELQEEEIINNIVMDKIQNPENLIPDLEDIIKLVKKVTISINEEQASAYLFAKRIGITTMDSYEQARPYDSVTRGEFAKMISTFAQAILGQKMNVERYAMCKNYSDIADQGDLQIFIVTACMLQVMGLETDGVTPLKEFKPNDTITRAQIATTISRALFDRLYDGGEPYYVKHMAGLKERGIITVDDPNMIDERVNVFIMFLRIVEKGQYK